MKELFLINEILNHEAPEILESDGLTIARGDSPLTWAYLPEHPRLLLDEAVTLLDRAIPEDFTYVIFFDCERASLLLEFEDGAMMGAGNSEPVTSGATIIEHFACYDWEEQRTDAMQGCQMFDQMAEFAKTQPARVPSTKSLQRACREDLKEWIKEKRRDATKVHVCYFQDEDFGEEEFSNMEDFICELPNMMTVELHVITVVADGKPMPVKRIDELKSIALESLKDMPISYARATGRL